jgi:hypothetical protein
LSLIPLLEAALDQTIEPYSSPGRTTPVHSHRAQSGEGPQLLALSLVHFLPSYSLVFGRRQ